mgnify:FL=1
MSAKHLRRTFRHEFKHLSRSGLGAAGVVFASYLLTIAGSIALGAVLIADLGLASAPWVAILAVVIATRLRGLNNIVHECSHYTFTRSIRANVMFGRIAAVVLLGGFRKYEREHATHHTFLGDHEQDKDFENLQVFGIDKPVTWSSLARHIATPILGLHLRRYFPVDLSFEDGRAVGLAKLGLLAGVALGVWLAPWTTVFMVLVPYLYVMTAINYWNDCVDHAGLIAETDDLYASRNLILPLPLRALLFPRNDCFHLVHHLFPSVPVQHLPACHRRLLSDPTYAALQHHPRLPKPQSTGMIGLSAS